MIVRATLLARLALQFSRVERVTRHEDGERPETDSDHSIMLALVACDLAPSSLRSGRIAEFSVVHDLVEVYAGDAQTLTIDAAGRVEKAERERAAFARLRAELGETSWVIVTLAAYEAQIEPEARYVRLMDKVLPKLTHLFNRGVAAKKLTDLQGFREAHEAQHRKLVADYGDEPWALETLSLLHEAMVASELAWGE